MWLFIIFEVTKIYGFTLSVEDTFLEKPQGAQIGPPPSCLRVKSVLNDGNKQNSQVFLDGYLCKLPE